MGIREGSIRRYSRRQIQRGRLYQIPTPRKEQLDKAHKVAIGVPNMSIFTIGARSAFNPSPTDGHLWFSPIIPKSGEAILEAQDVFMKAFRDLNMPSLVSPFSVPATWMFRAFVFIMGLPVYRNNIEQNKKTRESGQTSDPSRRRPRLGRIPYAARISAAGDGRLLVQQPRAAAFA